MKTYYQNTGPDEFFGGLYQRCSVCSQVNRTDRAPRLGQYATPADVLTLTPATAKTFYKDNASANGCAFCGSPLWADGGKRGDLGNWVHSR